MRSCKAMTYYLASYLKPWQGVFLDFVMVFGMHTLFNGANVYFRIMRSLERILVKIICSKFVYSVAIFWNSANTALWCLYKFLNLIWIPHVPNLIDSFSINLERGRRGRASESLKHVLNHKQIARWTTKSFSKFKTKRRLNQQWQIYRPGVPNKRHSRGGFHEAKR